MAFSHIRILLLAVFLLGFVPSAFGEAQGFAPKKLSTSKTKPTKTQQIETAIRKTKADPNYTFFVVCLPEDNTDAKEIHTQWAQHAQAFKDKNIPVFFVRGDEAQSMLRKSYTKSAPAYIAFRKGNPYHTRSGFFKDEQLDNFLSLAMNSLVIPTPSADQIAVLFGGIDQAARSGDNKKAARIAVEYVYTLYGIMKGPIIPSYTSRDYVSMSTATNMTMLRLAELSHKDPGVNDEIDRVRLSAKLNWESNHGKSTIGALFWMEMAFLTESEDEVIEWIDQTISSPSMIRVLNDSGMMISSALIENERWEALAHTFRSADVFKQSYELNKRMAALDKASGLDSSAINDMQRDGIEKAALYHGALLLVGRDEEAWEIVSVMTEYVDPKVIGSVICNAAVKTGSVTQRHREIAKMLDQRAHAGLIHSMQSASATLPEND